MKYKPQVVDDICKYLRGGNNRQDSAVLAGISKDTFYEWVNNKPDFADAIEKAEAECKARCIAIVQKAALTTWQAASWYLERRYQDEFAIKYRLEHGGNMNVNNNMVLQARSKLKELTKEQLKKMAEEA